MRIATFLVSTLVTIALIYVLDNRWGSIPALGRFLSPQHGIWQNAEATDHDFNQDLQFAGLKGKTSVYIDDRLVPHVFAEHTEDALFVQGYLHAKFRLWQMEFQTHAAAGRISEILGNDERFIRYDREQRRLGMGYAAEQALKVMESDPYTKQASDAYTAGVNAYINNLTESDLPIEYKLLGYKPERWTNLKTALFIKQMTKDLAGFERDLEFTNTKSAFSIEDIYEIYPQVSDSSKPIVPQGTAFASPGFVPVKPATADSLYFQYDTTIQSREFFKPDRLNGSNNWAVNGSRTKSGAPILCNDPHLNLTLPSIWFEMQISTPDFNAYGVTFPGTPSIIIGFNDHIAFGFTNAGRDVKDYYNIKFRDFSKKEYWFDSAWVPTQIRVEEIRVKGGQTILDSVAYTVFGPVMYDHDFTVDSTNNNAIAVRWSAHDPSNEPAMWLKLNKAKNYDDYLEAIKHFTVPAQNMLFASKSGEIAIWQQGRFPARWDGQGLMVMPGEDSSYLWQGFIPQEENPHVINPASGYIQSANQRPVDSTYPYFIPGHYIESRGIAVENALASMQQITPQDMMALQNSYYNPTAADAIPLFLKYLNVNDLTDTEQKHLSEIKNWDFNATPDSKAQTIYQLWFDSLESLVWKDELDRVSNAKIYPDEQTLLEALLRDSSYRFVDNINTSDTERLDRQVTLAFKNAIQGLGNEEEKWSWANFKNPTIYHLLRNSVMPFARTSLPVGGWSNTINAMKVTHGPSWRMIVHLTDPVEAYGIYPGGQSGMPGSRFYDNFIDDWAAGKYYRLWVMKPGEEKDKRIIGTMTFSKS